MDGYDSDTILSQALDFYEEKEADKIFITQNFVLNDLPVDEKLDVLSLLGEIEYVPEIEDQTPAPSVKRDVDGIPVACRPTSTAPQDKGETPRFKPVTSDRMANMSKPQLPNNTLRKNTLAMKVYTDWVDHCLDKGQDKSVNGILKENSDILTLSLYDLNIVLSAFILSLKKQDGTEYTGASLFSIVTSLQRHMDVNGRRVAFLKDSQFGQLRNCLDNCMQFVTKQGIGINKKQASVISVEQENELWDKGILGDDDPQKLLYSVFWAIGVNFGLRGGDEHRNLTLDNFKVDRDADGRQYIEYCECVSKTYQGGLKHRKITPHKARAYEILGSNRCPVYLFQKYVSKLNPNNSRAAFYFQSLSKPEENVWFSLSPVGHNKLKEFVKVIMGQAGFQGNFTNHSLRATTATRLFQGNVPEQLIMEQTGHRSSAIQSYKRPSDEQKRFGSTILQGKASAHEHDADKKNQTPDKGNIFNVTNSELHFHFG